MYQDMFGERRMKINFHMHTRLSDGRLQPEEAAETYKNAGYDAVAFTDHWKYGPSGVVSGLRILSGAEYDLGGQDGIPGVYHVVGLGCTEEPQLVKYRSTVQEMLDEIHRCGGLAVLAHPAWSLNRASEAVQYPGFDATEIYNSVSDAHNSCRPYSGDFADTALCLGVQYPLLATDDTHYYDGTDETQSYVMLKCAEDASDAEILQAIRDKAFYATQGPEIHLHQEGGEMVLDCSPAVRVCFFSNAAFAKGHSQLGENITQVRLTIRDFETAIRAEVTDANGKKAWTNFVPVQR